MVVGRLGLPAGREDALAEIESELVGERADALGRAGSRLEAAIDRWRRLLAAGEATAEEREAALSEIRDALWSLLVQRECAGFRFDNLGWVRRLYDVPVEAVRRL